MNNFLLMVKTMEKLANKRKIEKRNNFSDNGSKLVNPEIMIVAIKTDKVNKLIDIMIKFFISASEK